MKRRRPKQLPLVFERTHGGRREGAGRPRGRHTVAHRKRPEHRDYFPVHVTMRARGGLPPFREEALASIVRGAIRATSLAWFRVIHFSIQSNHLHLIVEANDTVSLSRGMQSLNARIARRINRTLDVRGRLWRERYHARSLESPRSVRNALVYVLMNAKKHGVASGIDSFSSAPWFDGFAGGAPLRVHGSPVAAPRTWLARVGWRRNGLVRLDERPG
jgi:REP element-mobilizing transposase RayT